MSAFRTETSHLLLYDPDKSRTTVHCFFAHPTPLEGKTLGQLFALLEIENRDPQNHEVIVSLQQELTRRYYQSDDFHVETAFEHALQATNERLQHLLTEDLGAWLPKLNVVIGVLKESSLYLTVVGRTHAYLVHGQRIIDILETSAGAPQEEISPLKIFTNIISGQLSPDDSLLLCTTSLLDYLSQEKLKRLILEHRPAEVIQSLEELLSEAESSSSFGALILKLLPEPAAGEVPAVIPFTPNGQGEILRPQSSMQELIAREDKTNELLTHSLWPNVGRLLKSSSRYMRSVLEERLTDRTSVGQDELPPQPMRGETKRSLLGNIGYGLWVVLRTILRGLGAVAEKTASLVRRQRVRQGLRTIPGSTNRQLAQGAWWFRHLTPNRRRLLLVALVLIILFAQSVVVLGRRQEEQQKTTANRAGLTQAQEKIQAADAALLIQNESGARRYLHEANEILNQLPTKPKSLAEDVAALRLTLEAKQQQLRHVQKVTPDLVYDLAGLEVGFTTPSITIVDSSLYTFSSQTDSVFRILLNEKTSEVMVGSPSLEHRLQYFVPERETSLYIFQANGSIQEMNLTKPELATLTVNYANEPRDIRDAYVYNNRLYTLDVTNNQIFRHQRSGAGFGTGTAWTADASLDLRDAASMAVDGAIYVGKTNGEILKLVAGKKDSVTFDPVDPVLTSPSVVETTSGVTTLFVLDPKEQRIIEFSKDGAFLRQYTANEFTDLRDLVVRDNTVYVLNGAQIFRFSVVSTEPET